MPTGRPTDQWGNGVTAAGADAVRALDKTLMGYLALGRETGPLLKDALTADPDMVMAHCLKGYFFLLMATGALRDRVPKVLAAAEEGLEGGTAREKTHVRALKHWLDGDAAGAVKAWEEILADHPLDVLALRLAHHAYFYMGAAGGMLLSVESVLDAWDEGTPGYGFVLGMRSFGLEESGDYGAAEEAGRRYEINFEFSPTTYGHFQIMDDNDSSTQTITDSGKEKATIATGATVCDYAYIYAPGMTGQPMCFFKIAIGGDSFTSKTADSCYVLPAMSAISGQTVTRIIQVNLKMTGISNLSIMVIPRNIY